MNNQNLRRSGGEFSRWSKGEERKKRGKMWRIGVPVWLLALTFGVFFFGTQQRLRAQTGVGPHGGGPPGSITFYSARDGNNEIYVMNADGSDPFRVTNDPSSDVDPDISPNGGQIVFTSNRTGNNDIYIVGSSGGEPRNLTNHPANDGWARWSPDGQRIVFHSNRDGNFEIYVMNADGSGTTRLTNYPGVDMFPDWSPDGQQIVFRRDQDIYVMNLNSGEPPHQLTHDSPQFAQMAAWSPNGQYLAFMSFREGYCSVFRMNSDGTEQTNLTPKNPTDPETDWCSRAPSWSTNGQKILFMSFRPSTGGDNEVFSMDTDGLNVQRLTNSPGVDGSPRAR
jgi:Tol biopolymer transport system component